MIADFLDWCALVCRLERGKAVRLSLGLDLGPGHILTPIPKARDREPLGLSERVSLGFVG